jgi:uncharacterized NAD(P)/FAD-binding protein YdhS
MPHGVPSDAFCTKLVEMLEIRPFRVVVVGAGFAGTATTVALLRTGRPLDVTLVERSGVFGRGVAYSTDDPQHLLNVCAGRMSALDDRPGDLVEWCEEPADEYIPRGRYGDYLQAVLARYDRGRVRRVHDEAVALERGAVITRGGERLEADAVVLATGISPPAAVRGPVGHPAYVADPWDRDAVAALSGRDEVLIVGTGLTMVDLALTLGGGPRLTAISRTGELPRCHSAGLPRPGTPAVLPGETTSADVIADRVATLAQVGEWRTVVDSLRPVTQELWRSLPVAEKARFLERHARDWEVRRHRMAPRVAARLRELIASGGLRVAAGGVEAIEPAGDRLAVRTRDETLLVDGAINATGPAWDCRHGDSELVRCLLASGVAAPGPLGLGLRTDPGGALIDRHGHGSRSLFTLGALRRGELWETVAVPEIRTQAAALAARIAALATVRAA